LFIYNHLHIASYSQISATRLATAAKEKKHCIYNAASNKREQLHNMVQELEVQKRNAKRVSI